MINNSIAGSEKAGMIFPGVSCDDNEAIQRIHGNEVSETVWEFFDIGHTLKNLMFLQIYNICTFVSITQTHLTL